MMVFFSWKRLSMTNQTTLIGKIQVLVFDLVTFFVQVYRKHEDVVTSSRETMKILTGPSLPVQQALSQARHSATSLHQDQEQKVMPRLTRLRLALKAILID